MERSRDCRAHALGGGAVGNKPHVAPGAAGGKIGGGQLKKLSETLAGGAKADVGDTSFETESPAIANHIKLQNNR